MNICTDIVEMQQAQQKLNDSQLAMKASISRQTLCVVKKCGRCKPVTAGKIAAALGVPVESIIKKEGGNA